jgi:hypothetical protein
VILKQPAELPDSALQEGQEERKDTSLDTSLKNTNGRDTAPVMMNQEKEDKQVEQPDLMALRTEYATLSQQLEQLDVHKQAGQWARLYKRVKAAEERLRQAEQKTSPPECATQPPECAKQQAAPASEGGAALPIAEQAATDERQAQLRAIASELLSWKGGLKVLRQAQLPKWRGCFQWQIEAKIEALQAAYTTLRAESAKPDG